MSEQGWHLDRRVPISILVVLVLQFAGGVWMMANMNGDISRNTRDIARVERSVELMAQSSQAQAVQLGRIEEQITGLRSDILRLITAMEGNP